MSKQTDDFIELRMDAARICDGLSKIGYTPVAAICDIIDNAVVAEATQIHVEIVPEQNVSANRKNNVREYRIIDNGKGMDKKGLESALTLGASELAYAGNTLSKFGLGMKSASFSQGKILEVVSSPGKGKPFLKYRVSLDVIKTKERYGATEENLDEDDLELIDEYIGNGHGTIIRIKDIRKNNHPSIRATMNELQQRVGIVYYYSLIGGKLGITVDGKECSAFDVLFTEEADRNGNLDENAWNGREVRWIEKRIKLPVDKANKIYGEVEVTQLPHPPTFAQDGEQGRIREKYRISAGNYGYYVYRNGRLISWAERFQTMDGPIIPEDQDNYSFRGRICIDGSADDALNIDVKKSEIILSDEAEKALRDFTEEYRKKSRLAWQFAKREIKRKAALDDVGTANSLARDSEPPEELPSDAEETEEDFDIKRRREQEILDEQDKRFNAEAQQLANEEQPPISAESEPEKFEEIKERVISGENPDPDGKFLFVRNVEDFALWEPYFDPDKRNCVRINQDHKLARLVYQAGDDKAELKIMLNLILLQLAAAEVYVRKDFTHLSGQDVEAVLKEYRRVASEYIGNMARKVGDKIFDKGA